MDEAAKNISEDVKLTPEDIRGSAMKCAEAGCFGIGKGVSERDKLKKKLREYMEEHPELEFETREEWVRNMTPEERKLYDSMEETKAFYMLYANM